MRWPSSSAAATTACSTASSPAARRPASSTCWPPAGATSSPARPRRWRRCGTSPRPPSASGRTCSPTPSPPGASATRAAPPRAGPTATPSPPGANATRAPLLRAGPTATLSPPGANATRAPLLRAGPTATPSPPGRERHPRAAAPGGPDGDALAPGRERHPRAAAPGGPDGDALAPGRERHPRTAAPGGPDGDALAEAAAGAVDAAARAELIARVERARRARDLGELDDRLFARAQWAVRRALLALSERWSIAGDDLFWLPLAEVAQAAAAARPIEPAAAAAAAAAARRRFAAQRAVAMPLAFAGGRPLPAPPRAGAPLHRGVGSGGRTRGRVTRLDALDDRVPPPGAVLVVATVTPAMTFLLQRAAAVVSEHGGLLDHGAAVARELGVPCVVACPGAASLRDGDEVWVDGAAGVVLVLGR